MPKPSVASAKKAKKKKKPAAATAAKRNDDKKKRKRLAVAAVEGGDDDASTSSPSGSYSDAADDKAKWVFRMIASASTSTSASTSSAGEEEDGNTNSDGNRSKAPMRVDFDDLRRVATELFGDGNGNGDEPFLSDQDLVEMMEEFRSVGTAGASPGGPFGEALPRFTERDFVEIARAVGL